MSLVTVTLVPGNEHFEHTERYVKR